MQCECNVRLKERNETLWLFSQIIMLLWFFQKTLQRNFVLALLLICQMSVYIQIQIPISSKHNSWQKTFAAKKINK